MDTSFIISINARGLINYAILRGSVVENPLFTFSRLLAKLFEIGNFSPEYMARLKLLVPNFVRSLL